MYPLPERSAGWRMCHLVLDLSEWRYLDFFDRVNLCPQDWNMKGAREEAVRLRSVPRFQAILLGRKVASAFRLENVPPFTVHYPYGTNFSNNWVVVLPHPSGLCTEWNKPGAFKRARDLVQSVFPYDMF